MKTVGIAGGTGYGALELLRLIQNHRHLKVVALFSHRQTEMAIYEEYPHLTGINNLQLEMLHEEAVKDLDVLIFATPKGVAKEWVHKLRRDDLQIIDLSGDLRLSAEEYRTWYKEEPASDRILGEAVYGLPEWNRDLVMESRLISNPGCFPTASLLALLPLKELLRDTSDSTIIIDGKTGVSGAGRSSTPLTHFSNTNENFQPYKTGGHQHLPEIERYASAMTDKEVKIQFTTHLVPMTRGLMCTVYVPVNKEIGAADIRHAFASAYQNEPFVRLLPDGMMPTTKGVYGSNYCDIGLYYNENTGWLTICSAIDNLVKGASGQALQNLNAMNGWNETEGLLGHPLFP
ncbi:N-acetyl-gamma-glutamyl-phosphate reductase [Salisediminibacterium selenitireducens]|uniref:N-acetyl-gamma-glutamyl-phosphate reductase n=1 Tax=Bacillus selenitireducens (strain ATCC 700615 / DSM 15326 / MLS10) TaxID=439292 RepID=D6XUI8_BACIE|nr:N-acetyl-gamma-glutamyl-phosphate reductase [Salisediminibacterium selenitireducens]ADH99474.1 N-acetyl-gamma-glutamyl-phosphate reductase [[Bacillus] selenitireducens MLS10]